MDKKSIIESIESISLKLKVLFQSKHIDKYLDAIFIALILLSEVLFEFVD